MRAEVHVDVRDVTELTYREYKDFEIIKFGEVIFDFSFRNVFLENGLNQII